MSLRTSAAAIFLYHSMEDDDSPWTKGHRYVTPLPLFRRQIAYLQRHFTIVSTSVLVEKLRQGPLTHSIAAIHFDDGVRSYYDTALPYLRSRGLPSTSFLIRSALHGEVPFRNKLAFLLNTGRGEELMKRLHRLSVPSRGSSTELLAFLKNQEDPVVEESVNDLFSAISKGMEHSTPFMREDEVLRLKSDPFVELGSHTLTHAMLSRLDESAQRHEILEGHRQLSDLLGSELRFFAYPFGGRNHFNEISRRVVEGLPEVTAFSAYGGLNYSLDRSGIKRITLGRHGGWDIKNAVMESQGSCAGVGVHPTPAGGARRRIDATPEL